MGVSAKNNKRTLSEINMTPFVDVVLVLLVIFMVTAPLMQNSLDVALPQAKESASSRQSKNPITIKIKKNQKIYYAKTVHSLKNLSKKLSKLPTNRKESPLHLQADKSVPYGFVAEVLGEIKAAGLHQISLITIAK